MLFIAILYTTAPAVAVFARTNMIETVSNKSREELPSWFNNWETTELIKFTDKNGDGKVQYVADPEINELEVDRDIMVLANPEIARLPNWVIALVAAGGLAAARLSAVVAVIIAGWFGINPPDFVAATVALAFGLAAASFFPAIILGIFSKRMNKEGAIAGMLVGILLMLYYMMRFKFDWFGGGTKADWWFGISPEGFGMVAMIVNFIVSLTVSYASPKPPKEIQDIIDNIRIPSGVNPPQNH